jgi:hypothetical protein
MAIDSRELAWAAGLFEGEGCIRAHSQSRSSVQMTLAMTDEDSVRRFHRAVSGLGNVTGPYVQKEGWKPAWAWRCSKFEHVQAIVVFLWYGLGDRRRAKCLEVLQRGRLASRVLECSHPRGKYYAKGMCRACYDAARLMEKRALEPPQ